MSALGLGGFSSSIAPQTVASQALLSTSAGLSGTGTSQADASSATMTPPLAPITAELSHLVQAFRDFLKINRGLADSIAAQNHESDLCDLEKSIGSCLRSCQQNRAPIGKCFADASSLKEQCRRDLRYAEAIEHSVAASPQSYTVAVLLEFMAKNAQDFERRLNLLVRQIAFYEDALSSRKFDGSCNLRDCLLELKQLDQLLRTAEIRAKQLHENVEDFKEIVMERRAGQSPFEPGQLSKQARPLHGPSPFLGGVGSTLAQTDAARRYSFYKTGLGSDSLLGGLGTSFTQQPASLRPTANAGQLFCPTSGVLAPPPTLSRGSPFGLANFGQSAASCFTSPQMSQSSTAVVKPFGK